MSPREMDRPGDDLPRHDLPGHDPLRHDPPSGDGRRPGAEGHRPGGDAPALACEVVRRYLTEALFAGDEAALRDTVADAELGERAWLFWAAFAERSLTDIDVLFADASGTWVGAHLTGTAVQVRPWVRADTSGADGVGGGSLGTLECTGTYQIAGGRIVGYRETWA